MLEIQTDRLSLRRWRDSDRAPFAHLNSDPRVMEHYPAALSQVESCLMIGRIEAHFTLHNFGLWAAELRHTGNFIGYIGLNIPTFKLPIPLRPEPAVEIGWRLAYEHWGKGLATEGARAVLLHAFTTLNLQEIVSFTVPTNLRSLHVMEKLGMTHNPADDFDHPRLPQRHPLRRHVLYRIQAASR
jgi:RimJ/RimL family protein N-acetyltransferase